MADGYVIPRMIQFLHAKAEKMKIPLAGTFELSPLCNMNCKMCYVRMSKADMDSSGGRLRTADEWLHLAAQARNKGMLLLLLTGGEPFLWPGFRELYAELKKLGLFISINSNGTMIDEETVEWLKKDPPSRVNITLYGSSAETYERLCGDKSGYARAIDSITMLHAAGISVKINSSITPYNNKDVPGIIRFADSLNIPVQMTAYMFPPVRRDENMIGVNNRFSAEDTVKIDADILYRTKGREWFSHHLDLVKKGEGAMPFAEDSDLDMPGEPMKCRAGKSSFWITWDGRMLPCGMINSPVAYPFENGFDKAWEHIADETAKIRLPAACAVCEYKEQCNTCAAMVYTETGSFDVKPEYRCHMQEAYLSACMARYELGDI